MKNVVVFLITFLPLCLFAQDDDLLSLLEEDEAEDTVYATATFKGIRNINGQTTELTDPGSLVFLISHRFGTLNTGAFNLFGIDNASVRLGFEYGINDHWAVSFGRSTFGKTYDFGSRVKLLRQQTGARNIPLSLNLSNQLMIQTSNRSTETRTITFAQRLSYVNQLIAARKFKKGISLGIIAAHTHINVVPRRSDPNDLFMLGTTGRIKLTQRHALTFEYFYQLNRVSSLNTVNSVSVGIDIETGGHVFQLHLTNSTGMAENFIYHQTTERWLDGGIHFGFNVQRIFTIKKHK